MGNYDWIHHKCNSFDEFKLKTKLWNPEKYPCRLCKVLTTSWFFITWLLIFYATYFFIIFKLHLYFFKSILNKFCFLSSFFNPVVKNHVYLQQFVLRQSTKFSVTATPRWGFCSLDSWLQLAEYYFNCILPAFCNFVNCTIGDNVDDNNNNINNNNIQYNT